MQEGSEAKEKRHCLNGAAWDPVRGEVVEVLRAESLLCLQPLSALHPEPRSKVTLLSLREPLGWPRAWAWLSGQLFRDSLVPAQMLVSSPPPSMAHSRLPRCHVAAASSWSLS